MSSATSPPKPWESSAAGSISLPTVAGPAPALPGPSPESGAGEVPPAGESEPMLPQRPSEMGGGMMGGMGGMGGASGMYGSSPYSSYSSYSPYSRYGSSMYGNSMYGSGMYGSSMYGGGMYGNSMYGGGMYGGMNGMMGGMPGAQPSLTQQMESSTAATFQLIQGIVGAFGGFAQMLESTFMATHSSFFAMIGVAEQISRLRDYLGQVLSVFALWRWVKGLILRLLGRAPSGITDEFREFSTAGGSGSTATAKKSFSKTPLVVFFATVIGLPWLMSRLVRLILSRQEEESRRLMQNASTTTIDPNSLTFVRATYAHDSTTPEELSFKKNDIIAVLTPANERTQPGWWRGRLRDGTIGWFPSTHVAEIKKQV